MTCAISWGRCSLIGLLVVMWEAIHPHRKGKLHRDRSPPTTAQTSQQPSCRKLTRCNRSKTESSKQTTKTKWTGAPPPTPTHQKTKNQENQYNHNGHNSQKPISEQRPHEIARHILDPNIITIV